MTLSVGRLLIPFVQVEWADVNLTAYETEGFPVQPIAYSPSIEFSEDGAAGKLELEIAPHPIAVDAILKLKAESADKAIKVRVGYELGTFFETFYQFVGLRLSTGEDPSVKIVAVGLPKGPWTDNKISYTMSSEISLDKFPDFLKAKCGAGCRNIKFEFKGQFADEAKTIKIKRNDVARTPHTIIQDVMSANGAVVSISDAVINGSILFHYPLTLEGEAEREELQLNLRQARPIAGKRTVFILGPGSFSTFNRTQTYNLFQTSLFTKDSSRANSPSETDNTRGVQGNTPPQTNSANSSNQTGGTTGPSNPGQAVTGNKYDPFFNMLVKNNGYDYPGFPEFTPDQRKAIVERAKRVISECSVEFFMTPYLVGIKPGDILAIPSLKSPTEENERVFVEDWIVKNVNYIQEETGVVTISLNGFRPYIGDINIMSENTLKEVHDVLKNVNSLDDWNNLYWNITQPEEGNEAEAPESLVVAGSENGQTTNAAEPTTTTPATTAATTPAPETLPLFP